MREAPLKLTLGLIKPDASQTPNALQVIRSFLDREKFRVVQHREVKLSRADAERFYEEHRGKFFYNRLVTYMTSAPVLALILAHKNATSKWRQLMGPTKVYRTHIEAPKTIRGLVGLSDTRNSTHGSDSDESAKKEIGFFFPEFDVDEWEQKGFPGSTFEAVLKGLQKL